jgi:serine/threonine-protein kinase RsbW
LRTGSEEEPLNPPGSKELTVRADLAEIDRVREFLRESLHHLPLGEEDILKLELSLHEIFVNIALHAYPEAAGEMSVRVWEDGGTFYLEIRDRGVPFDPVAWPPADLDEKIRRGEKGGYGVHLFKTLMDGFSYRRADGENILTISKKLPARPDDTGQYKT